MRATNDQPTPNSVDLTGLQKAVTDACSLIDELREQRDALLKAAKIVHAELDDHYDVSIESDRTKEYPFSGAGQCMAELRNAIERVERPGRHGEGAQ